MLLFLACSSHMSSRSRRLERARARRMSAVRPTAPLQASSPALLHIATRLRHSQLHYSSSTSQRGRRIGHRPPVAECVLLSEAVAHQLTYRLAHGYRTAANRLLSPFKYLLRAGRTSERCACQCEARGRGSWLETEICRRVAGSLDRLKERLEVVDENEVKRCRTRAASRGRALLRLLFSRTRLSRLQEMAQTPFSFLQLLDEPLDPALLAQSAALQLERDLARLDSSEQWRRKREAEIVSTSGHAGVSSASLQSRSRLLGRVSSPSSR